MRWLMTEIQYIHHGAVIYQHVCVCIPYMENQTTAYILSRDFIFIYYPNDTIISQSVVFIFYMSTMRGESTLYSRNC